MGTSLWTNEPGCNTRASAVLQIYPSYPGVLRLQSLSGWPSFSYIIRIACLSAEGAWFLSHAPVRGAHRMLRKTDHLQTDNGTYNWKAVVSQQMLWYTVWNDLMIKAHIRNISSCLFWGSDLSGQLRLLVFHRFERYTPALCFQQWDKYIHSENLEWPGREKIASIVVVELVSIHAPMFSSCLPSDIRH